ncbi:hypothetical protein ACFUMH_15925 [Cellulomonas sp. NPDC057328]|uniref:hypothetical protein n=1 Tax=Cellulomonas sp. NPDC057328 TaxID=3346101 RepID=UPI0036308769
MDELSEGTVPEGGVPEGAVPGDAAEGAVSVVLRRAPSGQVLAVGTLLDTETAYVTGVVEGLDDPAGFEVVVVPADAREVDRVAPGRVHLVRAGARVGAPGFTVVRLARPSRIAPRRPRRRDPVDLVLALEERTGEPAPGRTRPEPPDGPVRAGGPRRRSDDPVADLLLPAPAPDVTDDLLAGLPVEDAQPGVPVTTSDDVDLVAGFVPLLCGWFKWPCEYVPASGAELAEAVAERRRPRGP